MGEFALSMGLPTAPQISVGKGKANKRKAPAVDEGSDSDDGELMRIGRQDHDVSDEEEEDKEEDEEDQEVEVQVKKPKKQKIDNLGRSKISKSTKVSGMVQSDRWSGGV